jgi:hypothetical protein
MRQALNTLAVVAPAWLKPQLQAEWLERYGTPMDEYQLPKGQAAREELAAQIGADGRALLMAIYADDAPSWLLKLPAVETLRQVWLQMKQCNLLDSNNERQSSSSAMPRARVLKGRSPKGCGWLTFAVLATLDWRKHPFSTSWLPLHSTCDVSRTGSWTYRVPKRVRLPLFCSPVLLPDAEHSAKFARSIENETHPVDGRP